MAEADAPVPYMERTRQYYRALGYAADYVWATFDDVPFAVPAKPLAELRIAFVTTSSPADFDGVKRVWSGAVSPPPTSLFTDNVAWDKESTHTDDRASFLPIEAACELATDGLFKGLTARFHGVPTEYSQRKTREEDAPEILARVRQDEADAAVLCPDKADRELPHRPHPVERERGFRARPHPSSFAGCTLSAPRESARSIP